MNDKQIIETLRNIKNMCEEESCANCDFNNGHAPHGLACASCKLRFLAQELDTIPCNWDMDAIERIIND